MSLAIIKVKFSPAVLPINIRLILMSPFKSKDPGREDLYETVAVPQISWSGSHCCNKH